VKQAIDQAGRDPEILRCVESISRRWRVSKHRLLRKAFIPLEVIGPLLEIKQQMSLEKSAGARDVRRLRQLQHRRPQEFGDIPILSGRQLRSHDLQRWARNFGLDKESADVTRQHVWGQAEFSLCRLLRKRVTRADLDWHRVRHDGHAPEETSWRAATRAVSQLLRLCHPTLCLDRSEPVRARYQYKIKSRHRKKTP
jgi:hypothetical protein